MALAEYARKRDFKKTAEPGAKLARGKTGNRFVIQKHAASRLHYDFRLEMDGVLKSWAVPKGVPFAKGEKRLAVHVEDHPISYIHFEGTIPKGQYGGGTVMVWDLGTFSTPHENPLQELESGKLHFTLTGKKLRGDWYLVQLHGSDQWLLIKGGEDLKLLSKKADDTSVLSGKSLAQISSGKNVWQSKARNGEADNTFKERIRQSAEKNSIAAKKNSSVEENAVGERARPGRNSTRLASNNSDEKEEDISGRGVRRSVRGRTRSPIQRSHSTQKKSSPLKFIEPMKARLVENSPTGDWLYEIKFDGFRALALKSGDEVQLLSRNEKDFSEKFPEIFDAVKSLKIDDAILDGEIVALDKKGISSFQLLQAFELGQERPPIYFYVFDLLRLNGKDLRNEPVAERKTALEKILKNAPDKIRFSASLGDDAEKLLKQAQKLGLEGLIGKRKNSTYESGRRSGAWIKLKLLREQEFVIGGFSDPEGSRQHFGALLIGFYKNKKLQFCGKVGTGFNTKLLASLAAQFKTISRDDCPFVNLPESRSGRYGAGVTKAEMNRCHWVEPEMVAQIKFSEWTRDEKLRQPVFLGLREDKDASEVVREKPQ
jgi:bifunctional non-homologous end joining protein LigD